MITLIFGTKAEFLRLFPLLRYLQKRGVPYALVHTCQNPLNGELVEFGVNPTHFVSLSEFEGIQPKPTVGNALKGINLLRVLTKLLKDSPLGGEPIEVAVFQGDTFSSGIACLAAKKAKVKAAHVEAGFSSGNWREPFPEEIIKTNIDKRADLCFAPSPVEADKVRGANPRAEVMVSGSTVRDSVAFVHDLPNEEPLGNYALLTMHRYENVFSEKRLRKIGEVLAQVRSPIKWPMHEITKAKLAALGLDKEEPFRSIEVLPLQDYRNFMGLAARSKFTITDGGSLEEESIILGRPCLLLRNLTEHTLFESRGYSFVTKLDPRTARQSLNFLEDPSLLKILQAGRDPNHEPFDNPYVQRRPASEIIGDRLIAEI